MGSILTVRRRSTVGIRKKYEKDGAEVKKFGCEQFQLLDEMFAQIRSLVFTDGFADR